MFALLATVFFISAFEAILNMLEWYAVKEVQNQVIRKGYAEKNIITEFGEWIFINKDFQKINLEEKIPGEFRIFAYGGSTVNGEPHNAVCFLEQLKFCLERKFPQRKFEIYNYGHGGQASGYVKNKLLQTIHNKPDVIIVLTGENEFLNPALDTPDILTRMKNRSALLRFIDFIMAPFFLKTQLLNEQEMDPYDRKSEAFHKKISVFEENIKTVIKNTQKWNIPLILLTSPSNLLWQPVLWKPGKIRADSSEYSRELREYKKLLEMNSIDESEKLIKRISWKYGDEPGFIYLLGIMYFELGDYEKAKENLVKAKDYDYYPIRALSIINEFIRSQAKQDNVFLIDIEEIFMKNSPQGITGYELIGDFCHPAYPGSSLIAKNIQDILVRDILKEAEVLTARNGNCYEDEFLQSKGFNQKNSKIRLEYLLKLGNFCIAKGNYKIARKYLQEASQIDSTDWKITSDLATIDIFSGEIIKGFAGMKKAIRLKGSSIDFSNLRESGFIQEALKNQGITLDKLEEELSSSRM